MGCFTALPPRDFQPLNISAWPKSQSLRTNCRFRRSWEQFGRPAPAQFLCEVHATVPPVWADGMVMQGWVLGDDLYYSSTHRRDDPPFPTFADFFCYFKFDPQGTPGNGDPPVGPFKFPSKVYDPGTGWHDTEVNNFLFFDFWDYEDNWKQTFGTSPVTCDLRPTYQACPDPPDWIESVLPPVAPGGLPWPPNPERWFDNSCPAAG